MRSNTNDNEQIFVRKMFFFFAGGAEKTNPPKWRQHNKTLKAKRHNTTFATKRMTEGVLDDSNHNDTK